jgi:hypothetical protein
MRTVFSIYAKRLKAIFYNIAHRLTNKQKKFIDGFGDTKNKKSITFLVSYKNP